MTFAEAYRKTGRIFCVTLSSTTKKAPPVLLNYMTAPNVTIASAVVASAAVPGFIPPVRLQYSKLALAAALNFRERFSR
jgi:NTE family protein